MSNQSMIIAIARDTQTYATNYGTGWNTYNGNTIPSSLPSTMQWNSIAGDNNGNFLLIAPDPSAPFTQIATSITSNYSFTNGPLPHTMTPCIIAIASNVGAYMTYDGSTFIGAN